MEEGNTFDDWQEESFDKSDEIQIEKVIEEELSSLTDGVPIEESEPSFPVPPPPPPVLRQVGNVYPSFPKQITNASQASPPLEATSREKEEQEEELVPVSLTEQLSRPITLRPVPVIPRESVVNTPEDELRRALSRKTSQKLEHRQKDVESVIARLDEGVFANIEDLDALLRRAKQLQNELNFSDYCKAVKWPYALLDELNRICSPIFQVRRNITLARKILATKVLPGNTKIADVLSGIEACVQDLVATNFLLKDAEIPVGMKIRVQTGTPIVLPPFPHHVPHPFW